MIGPLWLLLREELGEVRRYGVRYTDTDDGIVRVRRCVSAEHARAVLRGWPDRHKPAQLVTSVGGGDWTDAES